MKVRLSILLPTYNCHCRRLVEQLHSQCEVAATDYEIVVADDASPIRLFVQENSAIESLSHVRYIKLKQNMGRSAIRNMLAREAKHPWLLFIDGDLSVCRADFIHRYLLSEGQVVVGGVHIGGDPDQWSGNLRYRYEKQSEPKHCAEARAKHPHQAFRTTNFMVHRSVIERFPFDENIHHYGFEDVLFGKTLHENGIAIHHIDNPILIDDFEDNPLYLQKNEEALRTLHAFSHRLQGYSPLLHAYNRLAAFYLVPIVKLFYKLAGKALRSRLEHNKPSIFWFNIYKLLYYSSLNGVRGERYENSEQARKKIKN